MSQQSFINTAGTCAICLMRYDAQHIPRILRCGHTFCDRCLAQCMSRWGGSGAAIECPNKCHEKTPIDPTDPMLNLPVNAELEAELGHKADMTSVFFSIPSAFLPFPHHLVTRNDVDEESLANRETLPPLYDLPTEDKPEPAVDFDVGGDAGGRVRRHRHHHHFSLRAHRPRLDCHCFLDVFFTIIAIGVGIYSIILYAKYKDNYCEEPIAPWALAFGIWVIVCRLVFLCYEMLKLGSHHRISDAIMVLFIVLNVLSLGLYTVGVVFVYNMPTPYKCPAALVIPMTVFALLYLVALAVGMCVLCLSVSPRNSSGGGDILLGIGAACGVLCALLIH